MKKNKDRIKGALYGFAIGDAMGATTEFMTATAIKSKYNIVNDIIGGGWLNIKAGHVTDDTEMMLAVAYAYEEKGIFTANCCKNFISWYNSNPIDIGNACRIVIENNLNEENPENWKIWNKKYQYQVNVANLGNGGLMRCLYPILMGDAMKAIEQSRLTHNNAVCNTAVFRYANVIRKALLGNRDGIDNSAIVSKLEPTGHVVNTLSNVLYWFKNTVTFEGAIVKAVNDGGDADTIAALLGGLAGAYYGYDAIPQRWINQLDEKIKNKLNWFDNNYKIKLKNKEAN